MNKAVFHSGHLTINKNTLNEAAARTQPRGATLKTGLALSQHKT